MDAPWLFTTAAPVLLDGWALAGRTARQIYHLHHITSDWFGHGWSPVLSAYTRRHPLDFGALSDPWRVELLCRFAESPAMRNSLTALIPCSPPAVAFMARCAGALESAYVLLPSPDKQRDPLSGLVRHDGRIPAPMTVQPPL
jgi:hypothetical protein